MSFVNNAWYTAAWSFEVGRDLLARTFLNQPVVMFRQYDGTVVALADRCPHRFAPLSMGRVVGDSIECGYHGMRFNSMGTCVRNPMTESPPGKASLVRSYPIVER